MLLVPYMWASMTFLPYMWASMTFWPIKRIFPLFDSKRSILMVWDACGFVRRCCFGLTLPPVPLRIVTLFSLTGSLLSDVILFHIEE